VIGVRVDVSTECIVDCWVDEDVRVDEDVKS
jgi:hypothetical protein